MPVDPFGGFDDWSIRVREALIWLGEVDPCETVSKVRENDPQRVRLMAVVMQWKEDLLLDNDYTVHTVIERAINVPSFYNALYAVAPTRTGGMISNEKLGRWLKRVEAKIICGFKLMQSGNAHGYPRWRLTKG